MEKQIDEKVLLAKSGWLMLFISLIMVAGGIALFAFGVQREGAVSVVLAIGGAILVVLALVFINGMKVVGPNEALVLTLFGKYYGTLKHEGFLDQSLLLVCQSRGGTDHRGRQKIIAESDDVE